MKEPIIVRINGKSIETTVDKRGVQVLPNHRVIRALMENARVDLGKLMELVTQGCIPENDIRFIYQNIGYSVCGYADMFPGDEIENPLWD